MKNKVNIKILKLINLIIFLIGFIFLMKYPNIILAGGLIILTGLIMIVLKNPYDYYMILFGIIIMLTKIFLFNNNRMLKIIFFILAIFFLFITIINIILLIKYSRINKLYNSKLICNNLKNYEILHILLKKIF